MTYLSQIKRKNGVLAIFSWIVLLLSSCSREVEHHSGEIFAMNTLISLSIWGEDTGDMIRDCETYLYSLEDKFSVTREDSELSLLNAQDDWMTLSPELEEVLAYSLRLSEATYGYFDPTLYPVVQAWGFTTSRNQVPSPEELDSLLPLVGADLVEYRQETQEARLPTGVQMDLGAIAKGYAADTLAELLREHDISSAMLSLGGNIYALGEKIDGSSWNIGIKNPYGGGSVGSVLVKDKAVVTSGGYQRYFIHEEETYWHIIDPFSGYPAKSGLASVSIVSDSAMYGDVLSTAFFVMGLEQASTYWREHQDFEAVFICEEGDVFITEGLKDSFSLISSYTSGSLQVIPS